MRLFGLDITFERRANPLNDPSVPLSSPAIWQWLTGGEPTASGETINEDTALQITTVYACVRVLAESVASLPLKLYEQLANGRQEAVDAPLYYLLATEPNPEMSAFTFWETMTGCLALTGNAYAQIERSASGQPVALWPLHPLKTEPFRGDDRKIAFRTGDGMALGQTRVVPAQDCLHMPLFSFDGLRGISPIGLARQSLGLAKATEKFGARFFGNGSRPGGIMTTKSIPNDKTKEEIKDSWAGAHGGNNQGKTAFLFGDWTYQQIGLSPEDSQFLATRQFQRSEICGMFRVPPHMVGDATRLSNANYEQQNLGFITDTLRPYLCREEGEVARKLLPTQGRKANKYTVSFDVSERQRGDFQTTQAGFAAGRQWGWFSGNDVRRKLGENVGGPELDVYLVPVNMQDSKRLLDTESIQDQPLNSDPNADPAKQQVLDPNTPTPSERALLGPLTEAYLRLFRESTWRYIARNKRDSGAVSACFESVLTSIAGEASRLACTDFNLPDGWNQSQTRCIRDALKGIERRSTDWLAADIDTIFAPELTRAVRSILLNTYREAGAATALARIPKGDEDAA